MAPDSSSKIPPRGGKRKGSGRPGRSASARAATTRREALAARRRRRNTLLALTSVGVVIVVVAVLVIVAATGGGPSSVATSRLTRGKGSASSAGGGRLPASGYSVIDGPSAASLAAAATHYHDSGLLFPKPIHSTRITLDGKPEVLYIGAEFCPYCATERWPLTIALSKFGTFSGLKEIRSNTSDPGIQHLATLSYYGSHYTSPYLSFVPVETENTQGQTLQKLTKQQSALIQKYTQGSIPFVDLGGRTAILGAELNAHLLAGLTHTQILGQIHQGSSTLAANIYADAGAIVSNLCQLTHGKPGNVCSAFPKPLQS